MKLGFICQNAHGHLNPMTALARRLQRRNHEVIFLYCSDAAGLPVFPHEQNSAEWKANHKANAKKLQQKIVETNGLSVAADVVEEASGVGKKPSAL